MVGVQAMSDSKLIELMAEYFRANADMQFDRLFLVLGLIMFNQLVIIILLVSFYLNRGA